MMSKKTDMSWQQLRGLLIDNDAHPDDVAETTQSGHSPQRHSRAQLSHTLLASPDFVNSATRWLLKTSCAVVLMSC
jgi:hypothetical protein